MTRLATIEYVFSRWCEKKECPWTRIYWNPADKSYYNDPHFKVKHTHKKHDTDSSRAKA